MSDVNASDLRIINSKDDVIDTYAPVGKNAKSGIEVELAFINPSSQDLKVMSVCQNKVLKNAALDKLPGDWVRNEPTSETLEVNSIAVLAGQEAQVLADINKKIKIVMDQAKALGLKRSYFQSLPDKTAKQLLSSLMDVPRYQAFFGPPRADMEGIAAYFSICKSNQISVSYKDYGHLLANVRRLYFMAPFLFLLSDNSTGFAEGRAFSGHAGMHYRKFLEGRGLVPDYVFSAQSGEEYIDEHIEHVMRNPLYVYYNEEGELVRLPSGTWSSFHDLRAMGLNTATNYYFAETILWPDVKIAALKNAAEEVVGHRYEARMFGVGAWQHQCAYLIVTALAFNEAFAHGVDALLTQFGFPMDSKKAGEAKAPLLKAYKDAREHGGQFFDIAFGNGSMLDFSRRFADLLEEAMIGSEYEDAVEPVLRIMRTGCTDGKVNRVLFSTLDEIKALQQHYDHDIMLDTSMTALDLFAKEFKARKGCCARLRA